MPMPSRPWLTLPCAFSCCATFDATLDYVTTLGQEYVGSGGFPSPGIGTYENTLATAEAMNRLGQRTVDAGLEKFFGHNHDGEFRTTYEHEGETLSAWEILVRETDPDLVTFQLDVAWAAHAGVDVPALIEEYGDRIELLHVKDATGLNAGGRPTFTNLGEGEVPLQRLDCGAAGLAPEHGAQPLLHRRRVGNSLRAQRTDAVLAVRLHDGGIDAVERRPAHQADGQHAATGH